MSRLVLKSQNLARTHEIVIYLEAREVVSEPDVFVVESVVNVALQVLVDGL